MSGDQTRGKAAWIYCSIYPHPHPINWDDRDPLFRPNGCIFDEWCPSTSICVCTQQYPAATFPERSSLDILFQSGNTQLQYSAPGVAGTRVNHVSGFQPRGTSLASGLQGADHVGCPAALCCLIPTLLF